MQDLFGGVVYAGLDTDKYKYPIGSGRVTFNNSHAYMKAVAAAFIEIKTPRFCKKVQVDPYLEDTLCSLCSIKQGPYFCRLDPELDLATTILCSGTFLASTISATAAGRRSTTARRSTSPS